LEDDCLLVGYIGRIESTKSIEVLLKAIPLCLRVNDKIHFVIAGYQNPVYLKKLVGIIDSFELQMQRKIHFITDLGEEEKVELFHSLDIFVTPSTNESFGMVFLEAWACKKPVIGTSIGAIKSVVSDGTDGSLFEPGNVLQLSQKIILLASDMDLRNNMGEKGYEKLLNNYAYDIVVNNYRNIFIKVKENFSV
jgi:glycosyltransferase involved in cell wall biosynthesis